MKRTVIDTEDNSKTLLINNTEVTYHSRHGAITESTHIFIDNGLKFFKEQKTITVFEMGFGTGLNAALSGFYALDNGTNIIYHSIEKYPLDKNEIAAVESSYTSENAEIKKCFEAVHNSEWEDETTINNRFKLKKIKGDMLNHNTPNQLYDIIFFDAFGPKFQPDLWQPKLLKKMFLSLKVGGILMTYCAQGQFKRDLKSVGFEVENLPGPPGKREITRGIKR